MHLVSSPNDIRVVEIHKTPLEDNVTQFKSSRHVLLRIFLSIGVPAKTDKAFKAFLDARNPTKQHSSTLESYLIKPDQRVLKYPLLLKELVSLTDHESEEHYHLTGKAGGRLLVFRLGRGRELAVQSSGRMRP